MRQTDIAIIGGGLAGSTAGAMLGRAGISAVLIDPHPVYPPDFRCEKMTAEQIPLLEKTGLAGDVLPATTHENTVWVARFGHVIDKRPVNTHGIMYDTLVNTMRAAIPTGVETIIDKAAGITTSSDRQIVTLASGEEISARLVVLANGLNIGLRHNIGIERIVTSPCHSMTLGFDLNPAGRKGFDFGALTYFPESPADRAAYLTLFPVGETMRANLMLYRDMDDPWLRAARHDMARELFNLMPNLRRITGEIEAGGPVRVRPADLYVTRGHRQAGIVLVGDAFATSCPAAGTGTHKVFTDVERLCHVHIPAWLETPGMGAAKINTFYDDPVKQACDKMSADKACQLKSISIDTGLASDAQRWLRFLAHFGVGALRQVRGGLMPRAAAQH